MQIILEGPDNAGKSTLAAHLSDALDIDVQHSGGPSKWPGEVNSRCFEFNQRRMTQLFDRHPAISQNIYVEALNNNGELVTEENVAEFYDSHPLIIYCKNVRGVEGHEQSEHSSPEYFEQVSANMERLGQLYDDWAVEKAHIVYRIGDDMDRIVALVSAATVPQLHAGTSHVFDPLGDIVAFHKKFDLVYSGKPRVLPNDIATFRFKFLQEEKDEWESADYDANQELAVLTDEAELVHQIELQLDAAIDLMYVALGTAYLQGFFPIFVEAWNRVQAANMAKVRAAADGSNSTRSSSHDVVKPAGWEPPKHTDLIEYHAHRELFDQAQYNEATGINDRLQP